MLTAAEALKQEKQKLTKEQLALRIWNYQPEKREDLIAYRRCMPDIMDMILHTEIVGESTPTPDPIDTELEKAKKLVGTWVFIRDLKKAAFLVEDVERNRDQNIILMANNNWHYSHEVTPATFPHYPQGRCCLTDPPKEDGYYLVQRKGWNYPSVHRYYQENRYWFNLETKEGTNIIKCLWYPLPQRSE